MPQTRKPNFLFIITDQHRADHIGCYGHPVIKTPNIDSIAARGRMFENFYVACAICQPNRSTLMTGRMPSLRGFDEGSGIRNCPDRKKPFNEYDR